MSRLVHNPISATRVLAGLLLALATPAAFAQANCITFEGRHGGVSGEIVLDLDESQSRIGTGWWASITRRPEFGGEAQSRRVTLRPGERFSEPFDPRLGCDARRRYRFELEHDGRAFTYEYPSATGFTQERNIDLGALSRFFGIPAAPDPEPGPVTVGGLDVEGEWVRTESTYDPNDGMRILVEGDRATILSRPAAANAAFTEGAVIWRDIDAVGELRVLGSDRNYYPGALSSDGSGRISLAIQHGGAGSTQSWERALPPVAETACQPPTGLDPIWTTSSTALPAEALDALRAIKDAGDPIQTFAFAPRDEWVVVAANRPRYSAGFPTTVRDDIERFIASGREIDVVAFGPGGRWVIVAQDWLRRSTSVSEATADAIRLAQADGGRLTSFAFTPDGDGWVLTAGCVPSWSPGVPAALQEVLTAARRWGRPVHEVTLAPNGAWAVVAGSWFATAGLPATLRTDLERYRTDDRRRIDHVVLHQMDGSLRWSIVSNHREQGGTDPVAQIEHGAAPGDSSVYQLMRARRITGVSIAVVEDNEVAWTWGYGFREADTPESYVLPSTIFDAASISKPVAAVAALQLVARGDIDLTTTGVLMDLADDELPSGGALRAISPGSIHLAHLLSHCAGIDHKNGSSGAQSFDPNDTLPTLRQMFLGDSPAADSRSVVAIDTVGAGDAVDYSGANLLLVQALIEHFANGGFQGQTSRLLAALGMTSSTFQNPLPNQFLDRYAHGHTAAAGSGLRVVRTSVKVYPNQAAASLRATAEDLAQFAILLNQNGRFHDLDLLDSALVAQMLRRDGTATTPSLVQRECARPSNMGLAMRVLDPGGPNEVFFHRGTHNGYRAYLHGFPRHQASGVARPSGLILLLTGSDDDATGFAQVLEGRFRAAYGWPNYAN